MWLPLFYCSVLFSIFVSVKDVVYQYSLDIFLDLYFENQQPFAVSPHASGYYTFERFIAEMCSRDIIFELRSVRCELSAQVRSTVERAGCGRTCRGRRAGKHVKAPHHCIAYSETSDGEIPVLSTTCRRRSNSSAGYVSDRDCRDVVLRCVTQQLCNDDRPPTLYVLNAAAITKPHAMEHLAPGRI